jgi:SAM-dependent methyltransferase
MNLRTLLAAPFRDADGINRRVIARWLQPLRGRIVEIGAGGRPIIEALAQVPSSDKTVIDLPGIAERCKELGYRVVEQDAGKDTWNLDDNSISVVISNQCLEHIPNVDHFLSEARRVLGDGGTLVVSVPNQGALAFLALMLLTINPPMNYVSDRFYGLGNPLSNIRFKERCVPGHTHLRLFCTRAMKDLLRMYGFEVLKLHGGSWGLPVVGEALAHVFPYYGLYTTVMARKSSQPQ